MFRRNRTRKWLVAGLGVAAFVAPTTALAGNHNMSSQAYRALVAKSQAMNQRYGGSHNMSRSAYDALVAKSQAMNQRYAVFAQGQALDERYGNLRYGPTDGWYGYAVSLTQQSRQPIVTDGRSPDTVDFAVQAHDPFTVSSGSQGFQWGDFGLGGGIALGAVIILLVSLLAVRQGRDQQTPIAGT